MATLSSTDIIAAQACGIGEVVIRLRSWELMSCADYMLRLGRR
jgi:hypothetical protein